MFGSRNYIGLACSFHDPSLAIVDAAGSVRFAEGTERHTTLKRAFNIPPDYFHSVRDIVLDFCDSKAPLVLAKTWSRPYRLSDLPWLVKNPTSSIAGLSWLIPVHNRAVTMAGLNLRYLFDNDMMQGRASTRPVSVKAYDHHLSHAATACYSSPFDEAACAIVDGAGEGTSTSFFRYAHGNIERIASPPSVNSLGLFYSYLCEWCGFDSFRGEEWKVMGLAAFGSPDQGLYRRLRALIDVDGLRLIYPTNRKTHRRLMAAMSSHARRLDQPPLEAADLAATGQLVFCEIMEELLCNFFQIAGSDNLVLGGGCFLNSVFNGTVLERTSFKHLHVPSAPGDDGNSIGAALLAYRDDHPDADPQTIKFSSPYLGSAMSEQVLSNMATVARVPCLDRINGRPSHVAKLLAEGNIVAWVQGRAEFGPRALGNRSILADPRDPTMKDRINARVKFREEFRPFAPAVLDEFGHLFFENYQQSPYMERALRFKPEAATRVPAVVHQDLTGRVQSVRREWNHELYDLIEAFYRITGVPMLLNTSLNVMGRPIAHSVEDILGIFYSTGLDVLIIDNYVIRK